VLGAIQYARRTAFHNCHGSFRSTGLEVASHVLQVASCSKKLWILFDSSLWDSCAETWPGVYIDISFVEMVICESRLDCFHCFSCIVVCTELSKPVGNSEGLLYRCKMDLWGCVLILISRFIQSIYQRHVAVHSFQHFLLVKKTTNLFFELIAKLGFAVRRSHATSPPDRDAWWELDSTPA
jgi:hypothetical protein